MRNVGEDQIFTNCRPLEDNPFGLCPGFAQLPLKPLGILIWRTKFVYEPISYYWVFNILAQSVHTSCLFFAMVSFRALVAGSRSENPTVSRLLLRPVMQAVGKLDPGVVERVEQAAVRKADEKAVSYFRLVPWSRGITGLFALLVRTDVRPVVAYPHLFKARAAISAAVFRVRHMTSLPIFSISTISLRYLRT